MIKVMVADDHEIYLEGLKSFFTNSSVYEIVGAAFNGQELVAKCELLQPQIVLTDLRMPLLSGAEAIRQIVKKNPAIRCIVLTSYDNDLSIIEALEAGAKGYITKNMPKKDLFEAMDQVCKGYPYYCLTTSTKMVRLLGKSSFNPYISEKKINFSDTERKIIHLICEDRDNRFIAETLCMSIRTIENNRSRILRKMNVKTTAGIAIYAIKHSLYFLQE